MKLKSVFVGLLVFVMLGGSGICPPVHLPLARAIYAHGRRNLRA